MNKYDVNKDGRINQKDRKIIKDYIAMLSKLNVYDIDNDGDINDYLEWRRHFDLSDIDNNGIIQDLDATIIMNAMKDGNTTLRMDLNNDNVVNLEDVTELQKLANNASIMSKKLDVNGDGVISEIDGILLKKIIDICIQLRNQMDVNKDLEVNQEDIKEIEKFF